MDSKEDTIHDDDPVGGLEGARPVKPIDVEAWLKEERIKREKEVQDLQRRVEQARDDLKRRRTKPTDPIEFERDSEEKLTQSQQAISDVCDEIRAFLLNKNAQYGDSAIHPIRVFSKADAEEQLRVRMDDKLSRLVRGDDSLEPDEDIIEDLVGYWILVRAARRLRAE